MAASVINTAKKSRPENELHRRRVSTIIHLLEGLQGHQVGNKSVQKLIYFLQQADVPLNYRYKMYLYGPYCSELSYDLHLMDMMDYLNMDWYSITCHQPGEMDADSRQFLSAHQQAFDVILRLFKGCQAKKLELYATIHFVDRIFRERKQIASENSVIRQMKVLKPRYSSACIHQAYKYLLDNSMIAMKNADSEPST